MRKLLAVVSSLGLVVAACDFGFGAQCTALCVATVELTLVDAQGAPVQPGTGSVTFGGQSGAFDCIQNQLGPVDGGASVVIVRCEGNKLSISDGPMPPELELTVSSASGNLQFSGTVQQLSYQDTGRRVCGTSCRVASKTVTLQ